MAKNKIMDDVELLSYFVNNEYMDESYEERTNKLGDFMFNCETVLGTPIEIQVDVFTKKGFSKSQIACGILIYQSLLMNHKIQSGIDMDKIPKIQKNNIKSIKYFIKFGEML